MKQSPSLSPVDLAYCDGLQLDPQALARLRKHTAAALEPFHVWHQRVIQRTLNSAEPGSALAAGVVFESAPKATHRLFKLLYSGLKELGYTLLVVERYYGMAHIPDILALLKTIDPFQILSQLRTGGANLGFPIEQFISPLRTLHAKYSLGLTGAGSGWCEFRILDSPRDWLTLAKDAQAVCPSIVGQGPFGIQALAEELKTTKQLYLWWD